MKRQSRKPVTSPKTGAKSRPEKRKPAKQYRIGAEKALQESEARYRLLFESNPHPMWVYDLATLRFLAVNDAAVAQYGYSPDEFSRLTIADIRPSEEVPRLLERTKRNVLPAYDTAGAWRHRRKDGSVIDVEITSHTLEFDGRPAKLVMSLDITERRQSELALARLKQAIDASGEAVFMTDKDGIITYVNPSFSSLYGYTAEDILGKVTPRILKSGTLSDARYAEFWKTISSGKEVRAEIVNKRSDGRLVTVDASASPVLDEHGSIVGYLGIQRDISERKHAEEALRENEERFRALIEHSHDAITMLSADGTVLYDSPSIARVLGCGPTDRLGRPVFDFVYPEDRQKMADGFARFAQQAGAVAVSEARFVHKDGAPRWIEGVRTNLLHEPTIKSIVVNYRDITERRRAEEALANERALLRTVIDHIPDPIYVKDLEGRKTVANSTEARFCGKERVDEILGLTDTELYPADVAEHSRKEEERLLRSASGFTKYEGKFVLADGTERWMIGSKITLRDTKGTPIGILGVSHDITERKLMEEERQKLDHQIQQSQRLESLGLLAGGIAHDFNNLLSGIFGYVELSKKNVDARQYDLASERLSKALNVFARARDLSRQLITFSKGGAPAKIAGDIGRTLSDTVQFALSGSNVKCEYSIASGIWPCEYDPNQVSQVIDNIVINAKHAMPNGGVLEVSASNVMIESGSGVALPDGNYIRITIRDHGIGIPKEYLQKIFDPFFTTKHSGSGLGLATCWSIVKRHDGTIIVESEPGKGSAFHVYLPATHDTVSSAGTASSIPFVGHGKILVMDDEEHIREILEEILTDLGYTVETASNGTEAVEAYRNAAAAGKPFDIVMVDLTIPGGMGGKETLTKLVELEKNVCVIASSGYSEDPVISRPRDFGFASSIRKPYRKSELVEAIVHALSIRKA